MNSDLCGWYLALPDIIYSTLNKYEKIMHLSKILKKQHTKSLHIIPYKHNYTSLLVHKH